MRRAFARVTPLVHDWSMAPTPHADSADDPNVTLAEFFEAIERESGPTLSSDDHRALVAAVRSDRERSDR